MRGLVPQHRLEHNVAPWCKRAKASRRRGPSADRLASEVRWSGQVGRAPANVVAFVQMHRFHVMKSSLLLAIWCALVAVGSGGCAGIPVCQLNSECQHGFYCLGGKCLRDCAEAEFDCLDGYVCNANGQCEGTGTSGMGGAGGTTKSVTSATTGGAGAGGEGTDASEQRCGRCRRSRRRSRCGNRPATAAPPVANVTFRVPPRRVGVFL